MEQPNIVHKTNEWQCETQFQKNNNRDLNNQIGAIKGVPFHSTV